MREFNAILRSCGVSRTAQSFFESEPVDADLSWPVFDALALEEAKVDFGQSLATCPEVPQKRQSLLSRQHCLTWGVSFPAFPSFEERSGVVGFFCSEVEPLPWVEPEYLFFCLECEEPLPDLLSDLEESDFCSVLFLTTVNSPPCQVGVTPQSSGGIEPSALVNSPPGQVRAIPSHPINTLSGPCKVATSVSSQVPIFVSPSVAPVLPSHVVHVCTCPNY